MSPEPPCWRAVAAHVSVWPKLPCHKFVHGVAHAPHECPAQPRSVGSQAGAHVCGLSRGGHPSGVVVGLVVHTERDWDCMRVPFSEGSRVVPGVARRPGGRRPPFSDGSVGSTAYVLGGVTVSSRARIGTHTLVLSDVKGGNAATKSSPYPRTSA